MTHVRRTDAARLWRVPWTEWPFRLRQQWVRRTDPLWWPDPTPAGELAGLHLRGAAEEIPPGEDHTPTWPDRSGWTLDLLSGPHDPHEAWEHTRLHALAARAEAGDPRAAQDAEAFLRRWPPGRGIGWACTMEAALRLVSLVRIASVTSSPAIRPAIYAHAQWIRRHPSRGTSARNHRVAELGALAIAARALSDLPAARAFADEATEMVDVLWEQVHPDGAGVEQSPHYLALVLEWASLARRHGIPDLDRPIARAARFLAALLDATDAAPALGDDDGSQVIPCTRPFVARVVADLHEPVPNGSVHFGHGGLTVLVAGDRRAVFDHGPLGEPHLAAHGHANALALYLHGPRGPIVVGRGTGRYVGDPVARRFHRGTGAHPTVLIDGANQSEPADHPFLWRTRATVRLEAIDLDRQRVVAHHDGYLRRGVVHRRQVAMGSGAVHVTDEIEGRGLHHVCVSWPLAPGLAVGPGLTVSDPTGPVLRIVPDPALGVQIVEGGPRPGPGWHSDRYGTWRSARTILLQQVLALPVRLVTRLVFL